MKHIEPLPQKAGFITTSPYHTSFPSINVNLIIPLASLQFKQNHPPGTSNQPPRRYTSSKSACCTPTTTIIGQIASSCHYKRAASHIFLQNFPPPPHISHKPKIFAIPLKKEALFHPQVACSTVTNPGARLKNGTPSVPRIASQVHQIRDFPGFFRIFGLFCAENLQVCGEIPPA